MNEGSSTCGAWGKSRMERCAFFEDQINDRDVSQKTSNQSASKVETSNGRGEAKGGGKQPDTSQN